MTPGPDEPLLLLPRPRRVQRMPRSAGPPDHLRVEVRPDAPPPLEGDEAYRLTVATGRAVIEARSKAGARNARHTLAQVRLAYPHEVPCIVIDDAPAFPTRGVMLDVSRDRVPTMAHLRETVDLLASLKFNHLQLYTEHTFAYRGHEEVWNGWSPLTPDEVRDLDAYSREQGIELAANQNCFGHFASWLRHPRYAPLAETHGDWIFEYHGARFPRRGPFSLCPTDPAALALVDDLLGELLPCFSSSLVNIGCDETFDVGYGRSREAVAERGRAAVYAEFVTKIASIARRHGKRPMFWADIALADPAALGLLPRDLIGLAWDYEPDAAFGEWCDRITAGGRDAWVCPGTSSWRSITGRTAERRANTDAAARQGAAHGATGFLVTDWGDSGHHQQWPIALRGLADAAEAAWNGALGNGPDFRAVDLHAYRIQPGTQGQPSLAHWLDDLGNADADVRRISGRPGPDGTVQPLRNASALFTDLHTPGGTPWCVPDPAAWGRVLDRLGLLAASIPWAPPQIRAELDQSLAEARFAARRAALRRRPGGIPANDRLALAAELELHIQRHRELWLARSRPGGLDHSCTYYQRILDDLRAG